jgi:hypothetical protein
MVVQQQLRQIGPSRAVLRPVAARESGTQPARAATGRKIPASILAVRPFQLRLDLPGADHWLRRRTFIPYWIVAAVLIATVAGSMSAAMAISGRPGMQRTAASARSGERASDAALSAVLARPDAPDPASGLVAELGDRLGQLAQDLEHVQRDNTILASESRGTAAELSAAQVDLSNASAMRSATDADRARAQADLEALQERMTTELTTLQGQLAAAAGRRRRADGQRRARLAGRRARLLSRHDPGSGSHEGWRSLGSAGSFLVALDGRIGSVSNDLSALTTTVRQKQEAEAQARAAA